MGGSEILSLKFLPNVLKLFVVVVCSMYQNVVVSNLSIMKNVGSCINSNFGKVGLKMLDLKLCILCGL